MKRSICLILLFILFIGCPQPELIINEKLFPLTDLNTEYNDYNAAGYTYSPYDENPFLSFYINFFYSTDYPSKGANFDICYSTLSYRAEGNRYALFLNDYSIKETLTIEKPDKLDNTIVNSFANELGPYCMRHNLIEEDDEEDYYYDYYDYYETYYLLFFSSDRTTDLSDSSNDFNIYILDNEYSYSDEGDLYSFFGNNDNSNEKYVCVGPDNYLYFSSDNTTDNKYNIYRVKITSGITNNSSFLAWFTDSTNKTKIELVENINSVNSNTTCP